MTIDAMRYDPRYPDPISVAAYIARYHRIKNDVRGENLAALFNDSVKTGEKELTGRTNVPIQRAIDLVETARVGSPVAVFISREKNQSIVARDVAEFVRLPEERTQVGWWMGIRNYAWRAVAKDNIHELPHLPGLYLVEGESDEAVEEMWGDFGGRIRLEETFSPCYYDSPEDVLNQDIKDGIILGSRFVCGSDPELQDYLKMLGIKDDDWWYFGGEYSEVNDRARKLTDGKSYTQALLNPLETTANHLNALDYIKEHLNRGYYDLYLDEPELRDAAIAALFTDRSPMVRGKAAQVLTEKLIGCISFRDYDRKTLDALRAAIETERNPDVRLTLVRLGIATNDHLLKFAEDLRENASVRKEAIYQLAWSLADGDHRIKPFFEKIMASSKATEPFEEIMMGEVKFPQDLRDVALGSLIMAAAPLIPPEPGTFKIIGNYQLSNAEGALRLLRKGWLLVVTDGAKAFIVEQGKLKGNVDEFVRKVLDLKDPSLALY